MRLLVCLLLLAACGGRQPRNTPPAPRRTVPFYVAPDQRTKLSPYLVQQWRDHGIVPGTHVPLVITFTGSLQNATDALLAFGAVYVRAVSTTVDEVGGLRATATKDPTDQVIAMLPAEALRFIAVPAWVVRLDGATAWPLALDVPEDVQRRLDPHLVLELFKVGNERPYSVGGLAKIQGCLDDKQRDALGSLGAIVGSVIPHPSCSYTIITFEIPLGRLLAMAALPWITHIEGNRPLHLERS